MNNQKRENLRSSPGSKRQVTRLWVLQFLALLVTLLVIIGVYQMSTLAEVPPSFMTTDPLRTANFPWYTGLLSNLGVMVLSITVGCILSSAILLRNNRHEIAFLLASGGISALLAFDDLFDVHHILGDKFHIPEGISYFTIGFIIIAYLVCFYREIFFDTSFSIVVIALLFFGASMVMNAFGQLSSEKVFMKDSAKFAGMVFWSLYFFVKGIRLRDKQQ